MTLDRIEQDMGFDDPLEGIKRNEHGAAQYRSHKTGNETHIVIERKPRYDSVVVPEIDCPRVGVEVAGNRAVRQHYPFLQ